MLPPLAILYPRHDGLSNAVLCGYVGLPSAVVEDRDNLALREFCQAVLLSVVVRAMLYLVGTVLNWSGPAKIAKAAIRAVTVSMRGVHSWFRAWATKGSQNQDMDIPSFIHAVFAQIYAPVLARLVPVLRTYATFHASDAAVLHGSEPWLATDTSKIANRVNSLVTNDGEPSFNRFVHGELCHGLVGKHAYTQEGG